MFHEVYLSFESGPNGRNYIGLHSTGNRDDGYLGSYVDESFNPDKKITLQYYKTREAAVIGEMQWQKVFNVVEDKKFANRSYQTSSKFDTSGTYFWYNEKLDKHTASTTCPGKDWKKGVSPSLKETRSKNSSGSNHSQYGKTQTPESNAKRSEAMKGEKNHNYGKPRDPKVCDKISEAKLGVPTESVWWVNEHLRLETHAKICPGDGWVRGRLKRTWWVNEKLETKHSVGQPGPGWIRGRIWR